nr:hypothetical protein [Tanacetum cinerariifolium]
MHKVVHEMVVGECHEPNSEGSGSAWKAYINTRVAGLFLLVLLEYPNKTRYGTTLVGSWGRSPDESKDLDKNPLVHDMSLEIEILWGQVDNLHREYSRLVLAEKKWINYKQTLSTLSAKVEGLESLREKLKASEIQSLQKIENMKHDRADVVTKVVPDAAMKLYPK